MTYRRLRRLLGLAAALVLLSACANLGQPQWQLNRLRAGAAGAELAGIAIGQRDSKGRLDTRSVGCAQFSADGRRCRAPLTPDTLLRVASISKLATTLGVMRLVEAGKLDLDRDVSGYLGFSLRNPAYPNQAISLRQLLAHSSSLIDGEVYWAPYPQTLQQLLGSAVHFDSSHRPGSCFRYTNLNFGIIGSIVERASGERFDQFMQHEVFAPAHIEAGFNWSGLTLVAGARVGGIWSRESPNAPQDAPAARWRVQDPWHAQLDDFHGRQPALQIRYIDVKSSDGTRLGAPPPDYSLGSNGTLFSPQGGMRISLRGLLTLGEQLLQRSLISEASLQTLLAAAQSPQLLPDCDHSSQPASRHYGLGIEVLRFDPDDAIWIGHFGDAYGLKAAVLVDRQAGVVRSYIINGSARPLPPASAPFVELDTAEAWLLRHWPLSRSTNKRQGYGGGID